MSSDPRSTCRPTAGAERPPGAAARRRSARLFRALSDPTRLEILALIVSSAEAVCVCELAAQLDVSQPTISHHLKVLREARLVAAERRGTWSFYSVDATGAEALLGAVRHLFPRAAACGRGAEVDEVRA